MKRLCFVLSLVLVCAFALAGCHPSPTAPKANTADNTPDSGPADGSNPEHRATFTASTRHLISSGDVPLLEQLDRENDKVVAATTPSVVRVTAIVLADPHAQLFGDFPFKFPGLPHGVKTEMPSYGAGVIISRDGYIVTNHHVIADAQSVSIQLRDQQSFPARVVAEDEPSDIAVLKITGADFPALPWGDSDKVEVGEQVFAIGNPFDLDDSVSKGIVSAKGRNLPDSTLPEKSIHYEDYIQTDAAINVGNSGGALVNIHGELVGINAAIASFTRGSEGVGFSIPSNLVHSVVDQLINQGKLVRGYLGVRLPSRIDDGVAELLGLDTSRGALLAGIQQKSPAAVAKLRPVDFITEVDGHKIDDVPQFRLIVAQIPVGKEVVVNYLRDGEAHSATVKIAELPKDPVRANESPLPDAANAPEIPSPPPTPAGNHVLNGVQVTDLNDKTRAKFGIDDIVTSGVVVTGVPEGSPADGKGLVRGDVIEIACAQRAAVQPLATPADFTGLTKELKPDQSVVLLVHHGKTSGEEDGSSNFVCLTPQLK